MKSNSVLQALALTAVMAFSTAVMAKPMAKSLSVAHPVHLGTATVEVGDYRAVIRSPEGKEHIMRGRYREVVPPERLVMTFAWEDEQGQPKHETLIKVNFEDLGGETKLTFEHGVFESVEQRDSHRQGWSSFLDHLGDYLAAV